MAKTSKESERVKVIWQSPKGPNCKEGLCVISNEGGMDMLTGMRLASKTRILRPNAAGQYVLQANDPDYDTIVTRMNMTAPTKGLILVDPSKFGGANMEGICLPEVLATMMAPVTEREQSLLDENAALRKELEDIRKMKK